MLLTSSIFRSDLNYEHPFAEEWEWEPTHHNEPMQGWTLRHCAAETTLEKIVYDLAEDAPENAIRELTILDNYSRSLFCTWHDEERYVYCCLQIDVAIELENDEDEWHWANRVAVEDEVDWRAYARTSDFQATLDTLPEGALRQLAETMQIEARRE